MDARTTVEAVKIPVGKRSLQGDLYIPHDAYGIVVLAHGSTGSRHGPINQSVAGSLHHARLGTLVVDLWDIGEDSGDMTHAYVNLDVNDQAERLVTVTDWLEQHPATKGLKIGYFGATATAAALFIAAARRPKKIHAIVSLSGRPDLAGAALADVSAPVLLVVGTNDYEALEENRDALEAMEKSVEKQLDVIPRASDLYDEPGEVDKITPHIRDWFVRRLRGAKN